MRGLPKLLLPPLELDGLLGEDADDWVLWVMVRLLDEFDFSSEPALLGAGVTGRPFRSESSGTAESTDCDRLLDLDLMNVVSRSSSSPSTDLDRGRLSGVLRSRYSMGIGTGELVEMGIRE